jgi:hypothetical protein
MSDAVLSLSHEHIDLCHKADKCGLGGGAIISLIQQLGPVIGPLIGQILTSVLQNRNQNPNNMPMGVAMGGIDVTVMKKLLAGLITVHRDDILGFLNDQEKALLDLVVQKLS